VILLAAAVTTLLLPVAEPVEIQAHWRPLPTSDAPQCPLPLVEKGRRCWEIAPPDRERAQGDDGAMGGIETLVRQQLAGGQATGERQWTHRVSLDPRWERRPGFFSGLSVVLVRLDISRRGQEPGCLRSWAGELVIDQGRRGEEDYAVEQVGRLVANFLLAEVR